LSGGDVMWQKERLVNIGIEKLPNDTDTVIVLDTDIIFSSEETLEYIEYELNNYKAVQCFSDCRNLNPYLIDFESIDYTNLSPDNHEYFFGDKIYSSAFAYEIFGNVHRGQAGYAWAFKYDTIKKIKLYEENIIGSGNKTMVFAFLGLSPRKTIRNHEIFSKILVEDSFDSYISYLTKVKNHGITRNDISYLDFPIYHLHHGIDSLPFDTMRKFLRKNKFNFQKDLIKTEGKPFKFCKHVSNDLKAGIENIFRSVEYI
jgi:hypothetical protein